MCWDVAVASRFAYSFCSARFWAEFAVFSPRAEKNTQRFTTRGNYNDIAHRPCIRVFTVYVGLGIIGKQGKHAKIGIYEASNI